jgi:hypothetical protein
MLLILAQTFFESCLNRHLLFLAQYCCLNFAHIHYVGHLLALDKGIMLKKLSFREQAAHEFDCPSLE